MLRGLIVLIHLLNVMKQNAKIMIITIGIVSKNIVRISLVLIQLKSASMNLNVKILDMHGILHKIFVIELNVLILPQFAKMKMNVIKIIIYGMIKIVLLIFASIILYNAKTGTIVNLMDFIGNLQIKFVKKFNVVILLLFVLVHNNRDIM